MREKGRKYAVIYQSATGNTRLLAEYLYRDLRTGEKTIRDLDADGDFPDADVYLVFFGVRNEACSADIIHCLERLENKKIALFATCGFTPKDTYKKKLERALTVWLPENSEYLGMFLCQGQVPSEQQERMLEAAPLWEEPMRAMFEEGEYRPGLEDLQAGSAFLQRITEKLEAEKIPVR